MAQICPYRVNIVDDDYMFFCSALQERFHCATITCIGTDMCAECLDAENKIML
jgi:hypothetical protein